MTREFAKENIDIIKAFGEGKTIQFYNIYGSDGKWEDVDIDDLRFDHGTGRYRIKPEPNGHYIPWTNENCPLHAGSVIKSKKGNELLITERLYLFTIKISDRCYISCEDLLEEGYTYDGKPCGIWVEE